MKIPRYRKDPLYWEPFYANFMPALRARFVGFKVRLDVVIAIPILAIIGCRLFWLGSPIAFLKHWKEVVALVIAAEVVVGVISVAQNAIPALWQVCRKPRFREISVVVICVFVVEILICVYIWHYSYIRSPHFEISVVGSWAISNVYDYPGASESYPVSSVFFPRIKITNKYYPATPTAWKLKAKFPDGTELDGVPASQGTVFGRKEYSNGTFIWNEITHQFGSVGGLGNGNVLTSPAEFIFAGVREETLLSPDDTLTIEYQCGRETFEETVPSHLRVAKESIE